MVPVEVPIQAENYAPVDVESLEFLSKMAALVPGIIYVFNHQTMSNEYANRSIAELLGYGPDEIKSMGDELLPTIVHPDDFDLLANHVAALQLLATGDQAVLEYRAVRRDGREVWLRSIETVFSRAADGGVLRHIGIALDITAEKTAEIRLRKLNAELEARVLQRTRELEALNNELEARVEARTKELRNANKELEQLGYIATHDLKVPINNMSSLTHMLSEGHDPLPPEHEETLQWMRDVCRQASEKLEALVCVAQANSFPVEPFRPVDLAAVTERVLTNLHYQIAEARAIVKTEFSQEHVHFLPLEVENILQAVLSNAIKYRCPDRRLRILLRAHGDSDMTYLTVADNGTGLDLAQDEEKVFALFQRAHVTPEGAGVALYTIRRIMSRIGGSIDVESEAGSGSTFTLRFPQAGLQAGP